MDDDSPPLPFSARKNMNAAKSKGTSKRQTRGAGAKVTNTLVGGGGIHGRGGSARSARKLAYEAELKELDERVAALNPRTFHPTKFSDLPLSSATLRGLQSSYFHTLTPIQAKSLPFSLCTSTSTSSQSQTQSQSKYDILGSARTGSGKTLSFLIPLLESLYRSKWGPSDGLGALVISPTRELAVQIFDVLRKIGSFHNFSAGLVIGGKSLKEEQERLSKMNILIATPGRLLQHMDQTVGFDTTSLQILVLDEADRCLDLGFKKTLDAIVSNLPHSSVRQTLLFSATQTNSVAGLARLSMKADPVYVSVRDGEKENALLDGIVSNASGEVIQGTGSSSTGGDGLSVTQARGGGIETPKGLEQHYMVVDLDRKLDTLWSFIKSHLACKTLVFVSSCKQVRFIYETFRHLRPGISLLHMHGKQKQSTRLTVYSKFTSCTSAVLISTDIAARGLDFPSVSWVVQYDAPEDVDTYVHRVGRTARLDKKGRGLLFLTPGLEREGFLKRLEERGMVGDVTIGTSNGTGQGGGIKEIKAKEGKQTSIKKQAQSLAFRFPEIKFLAQRAFISYVRSIHLQKDKTTFSLSSLPLDKFAESLGLAGTPKIKFSTEKSTTAAKATAKDKRRAERRKNKSRDLEGIVGALGGAGGGAATALNGEEEEEEGEQDAESDKSGVEKEDWDTDDELAESEDSESDNEEDDYDDSSSSEDEAHEEPTAQIDGLPSLLPQAISSSSTPATTIAKPSKTTRYDKMFARKNQGILSEHYRKVVDREEEDEKDDDGEKGSKSEKRKKKKGITSLLGGGIEDGDDNEQEDFIILAKKDRSLPSHLAGDDTIAAEEGSSRSDMANFTHEMKLAAEDLSKRRLRLGTTKKGLISLRGLGEKLKFDEDGVPHAAYEIVGESDMGDVGEARRRFELEEGERMKLVDLQDKEEQRRAREGRKRERKDREREVDRMMKGGRGDERDTSARYTEEGEDGMDEGPRDIDFDFDDLPPMDDEMEARLQKAARDDHDDDDEEVGGSSRERSRGAKRQRDELDNNLPRDSGAAASAGGEEDDDLEILALRALKRNRR